MSPCDLDVFALVSEKIALSTQNCQRLELMMCKNPSSYLKISSGT